MSWIESEKHLSRTNVWQEVIAESSGEVVANTCVKRISVQYFQWIHGHTLVSFTPFKLKSPAQLGPSPRIYLSFSWAVFRDWWKTAVTFLGQWDGDVGAGRIDGACPVVVSKPPGRDDGGAWVEQSDIKIAAYIHAKLFRQNRVRHIANTGTISHHNFQNFPVADQLNGDAACVGCPHFLCYVRETFGVKGCGVSYEIAVPPEIFSIGCDEAQCRR